VRDVVGDDEGFEKGEGLIYEVYMTGTPAKRMRWKLDTTVPKSGVTIRIYYPSAESRSVKF